MHAPFRSSMKKILSASSNSILPTSDTLILMSGEHAPQSNQVVKKEQNNERELLMKNVKAHDKNKELALSSLRVFPADAYPQKYVHSVFNDPQDAAEAIQALQKIGYDAQSIHFLMSQDYVQAVEQGDPQQSGFFNALMHLISAFDYGFADVYMNEALRGGHILAVHLSGYEQILQVRDLLVSHHAHLVKYIGTWTFADLSPSLTHAGALNGL